LCDDLLDRLSDLADDLRFFAAAFPASPSAAVIDAAVDLSQTRTAARRDTP
jgi:hypothetical protein